MTGEILRDIAACAFAMVIGGTALCLGKIAWWSLTNPREQESAE